MELSKYLSEPGAAVHLARAMSIAPSLVSQWKNRTRPIPAERCPAIELATGGEVTRRDLRPDDWWLIWPELVTQEYPIQRSIPVECSAEAKRILVVDPRRSERRRDRRKEES